MASALMVGPSQVQTEVTPEAAPKVAKTTKEIVSEYFKDDPIMIKIAWCESRHRQWGSDGQLFRGKVNPNDVGVMQINTDYHLKQSLKMNLDITTLEGNLDYARHLYENQGTTPWNSSSPCWRKEVAVAVE